MTMPTADQILCRYLFNQNTVPADPLSEQFIRNAGVSGTAVSVNANEFMTIGGGRYAGIERFKLVRDFLAGDA